MKKIIICFLFLIVSINCFAAGIYYGNHSAFVDTTDNWTFSEMAYGEMGVSYNVTALTITASETYYKVNTNVLAGDKLLNFTFANDQLTVGQTIEVQIENETNSNDITIQFMELILVKVAP